MFYEELLRDDSYCGFKLIDHMGKSDTEKCLINVFISADRL